MFPAAFDYQAPQTFEEALSVLAEFGDDAKILSGGQSLVPLLKLRLVRPQIILDINRVPGLAYVREDETAVYVGSLMRHQGIARDPLILQYFPFFASIVPLIGDRQVRSRGTMAGTLAEADPAGDWSAVLLALDASVSVIGPNGERMVPCRDWFEYAYTPAISDDEIIKEIRIPKPPVSARGTYVKLEKRAGDFAIAACAIVANHDEDGMCRSVGIGLTGVGATPVRPAQAVEILMGRKWSQEIIDDAAAAIRAAVDPMTDSRGSSEYKRAMSGAVFTQAASKVGADLS